MSRYRINSPKVIHQIFETEVVVVNLESGSYYSVEGAGIEIWRLLGAGHSDDQILQHESARKFLAELADEALIVESDGATPQTKGAEVSVAPRSLVRPASLAQVYRHARSAFARPDPRAGRSRLAATRAGVIVSERAPSFFDEARAASHADRVEDYRIFGKMVRIASSRGFDFAHRAFAHLRGEATSAPDLEICAWAGDAIPSPPWSKEDYGTRGEIRGFNDARFSTAFDHMASSLSMLDRGGISRYFGRAMRTTLPQSDHGAPFKSLLHWWIESKGGLFLHGAAIGNSSGAVLLAGEGGAGKSTTAFLCAESGLTYLGDDYCAVEMATSPRVHSLYGTGKLIRENLKAEKELLYLNERQNYKMAESLPLRAILVPRIDTSATETTNAAANASEGLKALAPSTISQLSGAGATTFQRLAQLVQAVPAFRISLARDFDNIPNVIRNFLEK